MEQTRLYQVLSIKATPSRLNTNALAADYPLVYLGVAELRNLDRLVHATLNGYGVSGYYRLTSALALELSAPPYNVSGYTLIRAPDSLITNYFLPQFRPRVERDRTQEAAHGLISLTELANLAAE